MHILHHLQRVLCMHDLTCDFWIARGTGSCRYLYALFLTKSGTTAEANLAKVRKACSNTSSLGNPIPPAYNLEDERDLQSLSLAGAYLTVCECVGVLPTLIDVRSASIISDREDRVTTLLARARSRLHMNWAGKWVVIQTGTYRGDVGFVRTGSDIYWDWLSACRGSWVEILVVPRVCNDPALRDYGDGLNENGKRCPTLDNQERRTKRLRSVGNADKRLESHLLSDRRGLTLANEGRLWQVYEQFPDVVFATDLVVIRVPAKSLTLALVTPLQLRQAYMASENGEIDKATLPLMSSCRLEEDERIVHRPTRWSTLR